MNITQLNQSLPFLVKSGLVPNIIGKHGIGKSSVIAQYAKENGYSRADVGHWRSFGTSRV